MDRKTQLYIREDAKFIFRKLPLEYQSLQEKSGRKTISAWRHSYSGEYAFRGYKNMSADMVTLGFARDIFLDPHDKIPVSIEVSGKPSKDKVNDWIAKVATIQRQIYRSKFQANTASDYINFGLITVIGFLVIGWIIRYATGG